MAKTHSWSVRGVRVFLAVLLEFGVSTAPTVLTPVWVSLYNYLFYFFVSFFIIVSVRSVRKK